MIRISSVERLQSQLQEYAGRDTGFVPTMGALHEGHLALVEESCRRCGLTVVSIFVNPTQFNNPDDLEKYPRDLEGDMKLLERVMREDDILFTPTYDDLYSRETPADIKLGELEKVMEGRFRPGHFMGVVRVVKLLFEAVKPGKAFFGQKDFQQLTIIREMTRQLNLPVEIVSCPIVREANGLAMSSRNRRLTPQLREKASVIYSTLKQFSIISNMDDLATLEARISSVIDATPGFKTEYFDLVDDRSLQSVKVETALNPELKYYGCIAVFAGEVRLIYNIELSFQIIKG